MSGSYENQFDEEAEVVTCLTKSQRRVLGVLVEKGLTTPDQYPLTLKATTSGANQKSNRDPVTNYTEGAVWDSLDELRELGLIAVVHPESGRTERFRHYVRRRFPFSEKQLAIMTELFLRGRQQLGELRARASRMVPIESLDELRRELSDLLEKGFVQSNGDLERRGIEVDHNMYAPGEGGQLQPAPQSFDQVERTPSPQSTSEMPAPVTDGLAELQAENALLRAELESLKQTVEELKEGLDELRHSLGV